MTRELRFPFVALAVAALWACSGQGGPAAGQEMGQCYPSRTCKQGLSCFSDRCVRFDGAAGQGGGSTGGDSGAGAAGSAGTTGVAGTTGDAGAIGGADAMGAAGGSGMGGGAAGGASADGEAPRDYGDDESCAETSGGLDVLTVPSCGMPGAPSRDAYAGVVTITVNGIIQGAVGVFSDPFYTLGPNDNSKAQVACPVCLVYNHYKEGACVCPTECPTTSHFVSAILVGGYPVFNSAHTYTVQIDLGSASADRINFAYGDCGCYDNAGSYSLAISSESGGVCGD